VLNSIPDALNVVNLQGLIGLKGGNLSAGLSYLTGKGTGLQVNADSLLKGIIGSNPTLNSAMSQLTGAARGNILNNQGYSQITATIGGIKASINNADLGSLTSVGNLIGGLSLNNSFPIKFTDVRGLTNLTTNIIGQAVTMGIPDAYSSISLGFAQAGNSGIMAAVTRDLAPIIINRSAVNLLSNVASGPHRRQLTASRPAFIQDFSRGYRAQPATRASTHRSTMRNVSTSFTQLNPTWKNSRSLGGAGARTLNLSRGFDVSDDFDQLLQANANFASVPVPTSGPVDYSTLDTSCRAVENQPDMEYDMELAQISALKKAFPVESAHVVMDPSANLATAFPTVPTRTTNPLPDFTEVVE